MTPAAAVARPRTPRRFQNAAEWHHALGDIPLDRIIFDPTPGTATEKDLLRFVEGNRLCELIDGTLVEKPLGFWESMIATRISRHLGNYVEPRGLGIVAGADGTMRMLSGRVRLPDVSFVSQARIPLSREPIPSLSPDLAVEVLSESNTEAEIDEKLREYFESGTRLAWVVDPIPKTAAIYHGPHQPTRILTVDETLDGEDVVPGFQLAMAVLFTDIPPHPASPRRGN